MDDIKVQLNIVTPSTPAGCRTASPDMFHTTNKKTKHSGNKMFRVQRKRFLEGGTNPIE